MRASISGCSWRASFVRREFWEGNHIPDGTHVILLPTDDPELFEANLEIGNQLARKMRHDASNGPVILVLLPVKSKEPIPA